MTGPNGNRDALRIVQLMTAGMGRLAVGGLDPDALESQLDELAGLYAEQTRVTHPFAPFGDTPLLDRAALRDRFVHAAGSTAGASRFEPADIVIHQTADPEVVVAEFRYLVTVDGRSASVPSIFVLRIRDGEIVESRDYSDQIGVARVYGRLGGFASRLAGTADAASAGSPAVSSAGSSAVSPDGE